jgi:hypothetical protein
VNYLVEANSTLKGLDPKGEKTDEQMVVEFNKRYQAAKLRELRKEFKGIARDTLRIIRSGLSSAAMVFNPFTPKRKKQKSTSTDFNGGM